MRRLLYDSMKTTIIQQINIKFKFLQVNTNCIVKTNQQRSDCCVVRSAYNTHYPHTRNTTIGITPIRRSIFYTQLPSKVPRFITIVLDSSQRFLVYFTINYKYFNLLIVLSFIILMIFVRYHQAKRKYKTP